MLREGTRRRKVQRISISPEPVPPGEILLAGESEDDSDNTRLRKKAKREGYAQHYLEHGWVPIMTASLKGPFDKGWKNPWAKTRSDDSILSHAPRTSLRYFAHQQDESPSPAARRTRRKEARSGSLEATSKPLAPLGYTEAIPTRTKWKIRNPQEVVSNRSPQQHLTDPNISARADRNGIARDRGFHGSNPSTSSLSSRSLDDLTNSEKRIPNFKLDLVEDLNMIWNRGGLHDSISQIMKWQQVPSKNSLLQRNALPKRVLVYGEVPVLLENGQVNKFSIRRLKGIRAKLSQGIARVRQLFDTFSATQNTSDTIACCDMLSELAQILQKVDHLKRLHDASEELSSDSSSLFKPNILPRRFKRQSVPDFLASGYGNESSSSGQDIIPVHKPETRMHQFTEMNEAQIFAAEGSRHKRTQIPPHKDAENDGDADMSDSGVFELMDISFGSQTALNSNTRNSDQNQPITPSDVNALTSSRDAAIQSSFSAKSEGMPRSSTSVIDNNLYNGDADELLMGGTIFVGGSSNPFVNLSSAAIASGAVDKNDKKPSKSSTRGSMSPSKPIGVQSTKSPKTTPASTRRPVSFSQDSTQIKTPNNQRSSVLHSAKARTSSQSIQQAQQQILAQNSQSVIRTPRTPDTSRQPIGSASTSRTPLRVRTADKTNAVARSSAPVVAKENDQGNETVTRDGMTSIHRTAHDATLMQSSSKARAATEEIEVVELGSDTDDSAPSADNNEDGQHKDSSTPKLHHKIQKTSSPGKDSATGSTSVTDTNTTRESPLDPIDSSTARLSGQTRLNSFIDILKQVQTNVQQKVSQMSQGQLKQSGNENIEQPSSPTKNDDQNLETNSSSTYPNLPKETDESFKPEGQQITQLQRADTSSDQMATELPPLKWADTVEKDHLTPIEVSVTKTVSTPRQSPKKRANSPSPTAVSAAAIMQSLAIEAKFRPIFSASQPALRSRTSNIVQTRRTRSISATVGDEELGIVRNSIEGDHQRPAAIRTTTESSLEDAQRQRPYITDSEEREALDAASSLLDIWDMEKEAFASK